MKKLFSSALLLLMFNIQAQLDKELWNLVTQLIELNKQLQKSISTPHIQNISHGQQNIQNLPQDQQNYFKATIKAIREDNVSVIEKNLENYPDFIGVVDVDGDTLLNKAVQASKLDIVRLLLGKRANANIANNKGFTPLNNAALQGNTEMVRSLIFHSTGGANPDFATRDSNQTPLNNAVLYGNFEMVELLLRSAGANPNIANKLGFTPLNNEVVKDKADLVGLLIEYGADKNIKNSKGVSALDNATNKPQILELLE